MQPRVVAASHGARWLWEGWRTFLAAPFSWLALVLAYYLLVMLVSLVPILGFVAVLLTTPAFSASFMAVARASGLGAPLELRLLLDGFRHHLRAQLILGAAYLALTSLVLAGAALADDGTLRALLQQGREGDRPQSSAVVLGALALPALLYAPVMMMFWYAPVLAGWHGVGPAKALFFSFFACLMNWRAFLAYGAVAALVVFAAPYLVFSALALAFGPLRIKEPAALLPVVLAFLPWFYASFYASYRDVFAP